jgi:L-threonylcarbamoyladenylate synthase
MAPICPVDARDPDPRLIAEAAAIIRAGGLVAFPTETVYGLGADGLNPAAVARIFEAKERPSTDPLILHIAEPETLLQLVREAPPVALELAHRFWPGPLTLVLPKQPRVPDIVTAGLATVAVRMPAHPVALALIRAARTPIAAPSANRFGRTSPTTARHVQDDLGDRIDLILDAGPTPIGVESTVLDLTRPVPTILRPGGLPREALEDLLGPVAVQTHLAEGPMPSPGLLPKHYAPRAPMILVIGPPPRMRATLRDMVARYTAQGHRIGLLIAEEDRAETADLPAETLVLGPEGDLETVARRLYEGLRELDGRDLSLIIARDFGDQGLGLAVRDRLMRAAGGSIIQV